MELIEEGLLGIWQMFLDMAPYLLLGFIFAGILHVLIPKSFVSKHIGQKNIWSTIKVTLLGVPLPLCSCGVIPTGVSFYKNGASKGATNSFLISTPQTGVDSILITSSLMNWPWAIIRPIIALITGIFGGMLTDKMDPNSLEINPTEEVANNEASFKNHWFIEIFDYAFLKFLPDISRQLLVGILIAVAITTFVPPSIFSTYFTNPFLNMVFILVASVPFYVCATGSVPIATSLLILGVSPGAVLVFLMAGPATNAATITVLWKSLGKRATLAYLFSIIIGALFFGLVIDYMLPFQWFVLDSAAMSHIHGAHTSIIATLSAIVLISLIFIVEIKKIIPKKKIKMKNSTTYIVEGMTCNHCKSSVESNLLKLTGIETSQVDLSNKTVAIKGTVTDKKVQELVDGLGFKFGGRI